MIATIRRHNKRLAAYRHRATIISFLWYFLPNTKNGGHGSDVVQNGLRLGLWRACHPGTIHRRPTGGADFLPPQLRRMAGVGGEEEGACSASPNSAFCSMPNWSNITSRRLPKWPPAISNMFLASNPMTRSPPKRYMEEMAKLAREGNVTLDDFDRFARHQAGQEYLVALVGMSGQLITPRKRRFFIAGRTSRWRRSWFPSP